MLAVGLLQLLQLGMLVPSLTRNVANDEKAMWPVPLRDRNPFTRPVRWTESPSGALGEAPSSGPSGAALAF